MDGPPSTPSMRDLRCFAVSHVCGFAGVRRARQPRRGGSCLCRECSAARVWRAASCAAVWPRALRLAFGRARPFQNAGAVRAARVALVSELVRRAAARGRARVEHGAAAVGLHLCWRLYWFRSLWLAAARELGAVTSSGCQRTTGVLRRSPAVRMRAHCGPASLSPQAFEWGKPERTYGEIEQACASGL